MDVVARGILIIVKVSDLDDVASIVDVAIRVDLVDLDASAVEFVDSIVLSEA